MVDSDDNEGVHPMPRKKTWEPIKKTCRSCAQLFEANTLYAVTKQMYCDRACRSAHINNERSVKRFKRRCKKCRATMLVLPCHKKTKIYCSKSCAMSFRMSGEGNPAWKGGNGNGGVYWKRKARERDGFACQAPGCAVINRGRGTHAHHKIPQSVGGSDSLENLITMCASHHHEIERRLFVRLLEKFPKAAAKMALTVHEEMKGIGR